MPCGCEAPYIGPSLATACYGGSFIFFMSIVDNLIRNKCDLSEICQRITPKSQPDLEYDFVVIGGGAAGSVVAARLTEEPTIKVLLIEAGGDEPPGTQVPSMLNNWLGNSHIDWNYKTEPQKQACFGCPEKRYSWPRGKVLGGCGTINGMIYLRGTQKDYDGWKKLGNPGWGYGDLLPYFKKSEKNEEIGTLVSGDLHGSDGPMTVMRWPDRPKIVLDILEAAKSLEYPVVNDLNAHPYTGFTILQFASINGSRVSSARAFLRPARHRPNLHIMLNSTATKIIIDETNNKRASQVEFIYKNRTYRVKVKKEVILSGGTINSPQLLLLSGIGPKEDLESVNIKPIHNLPGVGKNLHNDVAFNINYKLKFLKGANDLDWLAVYNYLTYRKGPMSYSGLAQVNAKLTSSFGDPEGDNPDLQIYFFGFEATCSRFGAIGEPADLSNCRASKNFTISVVNLQPKSRGVLKLKTNNPLNYPIIDLQYLSEPEDVKVLIEGVRIAQKIANSTELRKYGIEFIPEDYGNCSKSHKLDSDEFWECAIRYIPGPDNHEVGTCKMGPSSDNLTVVDPELQVYGIEGLRVVDASIMPRVVSANTHSTAVLIGEKGANFIKNKWLNNTST